MKRKTGRFEKQSSGTESFSSYIPLALPPNPSLQINELLDVYEKANQELGRLDTVVESLPHPDHFLYMYVRKEAVLSSQIEGAQSSLSDLLLFENHEDPRTSMKDVTEVSNYVKAMRYGLEKLKGGFPLSLRLIREIHKVLLDGSRGGHKDPGEFRRSQNWIGGTRPGNAAYVPPPPHMVMSVMGDLENFLHERRSDIPPLLKAGLAHAQFETIHPFLDGNGRLGRLLITFILCADSVITEPLLYLSLFFKENRSQYYDLLQKTRTDGELEAWMRFYLEGIARVSREAREAARKILDLFEEDRKKILRLGKGAATCLKIHEILKEKGILSLTEAAKRLKISYPAISKAVKNLEKIKLVQEITKRQRNRLFSYEAYLSIISAGI